MKKLSGVALLSLTLAVLCSAVWAADTVATVTGKVTVTNNVPSISVTSAKDASGNAIAGLVGKNLTVIGAKAADVAKLNGKNAEVTGTLKENNTKIEATSCKEVPAAQPKN